MPANFPPIELTANALPTWKKSLTKWKDYKKNYLNTHRFMKVSLSLLNLTGILRQHLQDTIWMSASTDSVVHEDLQLVLTRRFAKIFGQDQQPNHIIPLRECLARWSLYQSILGTAWRQEDQRTSKRFLSD